MGHKIFVSYKYWDINVAPLAGYSYGLPTARDYVSYIDDVISNSSGHIFKGEDDNTDLTYLSDNMIWEKLKDRIYDSSLTIVLISPNMKDNTKSESVQWIPWEVSFSLRQTTRKDRTSGTNAMLAVVLPDKDNLYDYYYTTTPEGTIQHNRRRLFSIIQNNMFNEKNPSIKYVNGRKVYSGYHSYIHSVKWSDFIKNMDYYINIAYDIKKNKDKYVITTNVGI